MPLPTQKLTDPTKNETYGTTVGAILQRGVPIVYKVPQHQRAYSWTATSVERYLLDLDFACQEGFPHNFGSLDLREDGNLKNAANPSIDVKIHHGGIGSAIYPVKEVNDGQQRLTTIFLTFSAIASIKKQGGDTSYIDSLSKNHSLFSYELVDKTGNHHGDRIVLQEPDLTEYLRKLVVEGDGYAYKKRPKSVKLTLAESNDKNAKYPPSARRPMKLMTDAYRQIREHLGRVPDLDKWENAFYASEIVLSHSKTPSHIVFEVRNARGIPVSQLDMVKNRAKYYQERMSKIGISPKNDIVKSWWSATKNMEDGDVYSEDGLLGYVLSIVNGKTVGKGNYEDFLTCYKLHNLTKKSNPGPQIREDFEYFIEAIEWVASCMKEVYRPHPKNKPMIKGALTLQKSRGMTKKQYTQSVVELINITNRMDREEICKPMILLVYRFVKPHEFVKFLVLLEKIMFRNFCVNKTRIDKGSTDFGKFCKTFFDSVKGKDPSNKTEAKDITSAFNNLCAKLCAWSLDTTRYGVSGWKFYETILTEKEAYSKTWSRYLLYHWEMYGPGSYQPLIRMAKECSKWGNSETTTEFFQMEHVMPSDGWEKHPQTAIPGMSKRYYWQNEYFKKPNYEEDLNWLGNLVLSKSKPNGKYRNYPYVRHPSDPDGPLQEKRSMYLTEPGVHDWEKVRQIAIEYKIWNVNAIKHRQKRMAQWAFAHWRLPCEEKPVFDPIDVIDELSDEFFLIHDDSCSAADAEKIKDSMVMTKFIEVEHKKDRSHPETDYSDCEDEHAVVELTDDFDLDYERDANDLEYEEIHKAKSGKTLTVKKKQ